MELPGQAYRRHSRGDCQGVLYRPFGASGPCGGGHHQGRPVRDGPVPLRKADVHPQLRPRTRARRGVHRRGGTADRRRTTAAADGGTGRDARKRRARIAGLPRKERHTGRLDPAGAVGRADLLAAVCRYAGHARQLRPQHPQPGVRPAHRRGDAFRRPRDGQPQMFRGERQGHPPGDRPRRNRQDRTRRRGRHRRCETNAPAAHPKDPLRRAQGLDRRVPRLRQSRIRGGRPQGDPPGRRPHPHGRGRRYRSACLRQRRGAGDRRRAAADVRGALFRVPPQPQPGNFGRSRHDGLRASGFRPPSAPNWAPPTARYASSRATAGCR